MFDPMSWLRFRKPRLRNWSVLAVASVWLLSVAGPADAAIITTGDVNPGGAATQPDPWAVEGLYVGREGDGTLNVEAGGVVSNTSTLTVGYWGDGTLNVATGGVVSNAFGYIGHHTGSTSEATITGSGSQWTNSGPLRVGYYGDGTLNVEGGGRGLLQCPQCYL